MVDDRHLHRVEAARDRLADAPHSDQTDGAIAERRPGEGIVLLRPLSRAQVALGLGEFAYRAQEEPERGIGDLLGEHIWRVGDGDAVPARPGGIDVIVADTERRNYFKPR